MSALINPYLPSAACAVAVTQMHFRLILCLTVLRPIEEDRNFGLVLYLSLQ